MTLDERMKCIADNVDKDCILADIGTDHAFLPIFLAENGVIKSAVACDINKMPLEKARKNIEKNNLSDKIDVYLTDGLHGVEKYKPENVIIAGMGGELIIKILKEGRLKENNVKYILQPMTREGKLREYLYSEGYNVTDEFVVKDGNKFYQIEVCYFDGIKRGLSKVETDLGKINIQKKSEVFYEFCEKIIKQKEKRYKGLLLSGKEDTELKSEIEMLKQTSQRGVF